MDAQHFPQAGRRAWRPLGPLIATQRFPRHTTYPTAIVKLTAYDDDVVRF